MKSSYMAFVIGVLGLAGAMGEANAQDSVSFSINLGGPAYYGPPPVYTAPQVVRYSPPPVAYYRPAPVHYDPRAFVSYVDEPLRHYGHHGNGLHRGWQRQHWH